MLQTQNLPDGEKTCRNCPPEEENGGVLKGRKDLDRKEERLWSLPFVLWD